MVRSTERICVSSGPVSRVLHSPPRTCRMSARMLEWGHVAAAVSSSRFPPSCTSLSTTVRDRPAKPTHESPPPPSPLRVPSRRLFRAPSRQHPLSWVIRPALSSCSVACICLRKVGVSARRVVLCWPNPPPQPPHRRRLTQPGFVSCTIPRLPLNCHPSHCSHVPPCATVFVCECR